jgi:HAE1 family hydrophobic/amphiphilic exporter-1
MISLIVSLTLIPMLSSLKAKAPMSFAPERTPGLAAAEQGGQGARRRRSRRQEGLRLGRVRGQLRHRHRWPWLRAHGRRRHGWLGEKILLPYEKAATYYHSKLPRALERPWVILGSAAVAFLISIGIALTLGTDLIPQLAQDRFEMTAKLPPGTQLRETDALVRAVQQKHDGDTTSTRSTASAAPARAWTRTRPNRARTWPSSASCSVSTTARKPRPRSPSACARRWPPIRTSR